MHSTLTKEKGDILLTSMIMHKKILKIHCIWLALTSRQDQLINDSKYNFMEIALLPCMTSMVWCN